MIVVLSYVFPNRQRFILIAKHKDSTAWEPWGCKTRAHTQTGDNYSSSKQKSNLLRSFPIVLIFMLWLNHFYCCECVVTSFLIIDHVFQRSGDNLAKIIATYIFSHYPDDFKECVLTAYLTFYANFEGHCATMWTNLRIRLHVWIPKRIFPKHGPILGTQHLELTFLTF